MPPEPATDATEATEATDAAARSPVPSRRPGVVVAAPVLGAMALVSAWTGWGGLALGLLAVLVGLAALARRRGRADVGRRGPLAGLALGVVAVGIAVAVEWSTLAGAVTYLETGGVRTLDECMRQAQNEKEQHVCKSQHLDEYRARYPGRLDP
ncbi:hypothetical protein [Actinomycetospora cinnamomea]|uniref:DUF4190 domain-containing protein n=1 Tax=Actinomycetospora cinnamomea TaxID=663609 RepID=A0A2U1FHK9_9PSEU|nr:hypothetical protein [Actinomycetospora cinnamomea]PVZ11674.1 hypothetical protein C8D89_1034 [Actinomycetospora cinnamomea]